MELIFNEISLLFILQAVIVSNFMHYLLKGYKQFIIMLLLLLLFRPISFGYCWFSSSSS